MTIEFNQMIHISFLTWKKKNNQIELYIIKICRFKADMLSRWQAMTMFWVILKLTKKLKLVTQSMMQHQPNPMELRSMDSYIQILCRFQISKWKVPSPSLFSTKNHPLRKIFLILFAYFFGIYIKFGYRNPSILTPLDSVDIAL